MHPFSTLWNDRFSDDFRGYKKSALETSRFKTMLIIEVTEPKLILYLVIT